MFVGVDANADGLRDVSRRAAAKPSRGGVPNALFGRLALEALPGELEGFADSVTLLLPWGSLLGAVARPEVDALARIRGLCKADAQLRVVFGYDVESDARAIETLALCALDAREFCTQLELGYRAAGFDVRVAPIVTDRVRALRTTWSQKLAFSGRSRQFIEVLGRCGAEVV